MKKLLPEPICSYNIEELPSKGSHLVLVNRKTGKTASSSTWVLGLAALAYQSGDWLGIMSLLPLAKARRLLKRGSSSCGVCPIGVWIRMTKPKQSGAFLGHRFPPEIIAYAVWAYHRFPISLRDVEDLLAARGIVVSYETIRAWVAKFGSQYAKVIRRDRPKVADKWHLDEVVLPINGKKYWLWRAVDSKGDVLDILVQSRRNNRAASRFFRKLFKAFGEPRVIVTDKLQSYGAALKKLAPGIEHRSHKGLNNRSEGSHRPTRRREKIMGRFKSPCQAQRFLSVHDQVQTVFRPRRHTLSAASYRQTRADAHWIWDGITRELKAV